MKPSWDELKTELVNAREKKSEQLRNLCSELLRRRNDEEWKALEWADRVRFSDSMAEFEALLPDAGSKFDGFKVVGTTPVQSIVQRADEALLNALQSGQFPWCEHTCRAVSEAVQHLTEDNYPESLMKLRTALQRCLEGIVSELIGRQGGVVPSFKEDREVRDYLERNGFLTREERKGFDGNLRSVKFRASRQRRQEPRSAWIRGVRYGLSLCRYQVAGFPLRGLSRSETKQPLRRNCG